MASPGSASTGAGVLAQLDFEVFGVPGVELAPVGARTYTGSSGTDGTYAVADGVVGQAPCFDVVVRERGLARLRLRLLDKAIDRIEPFTTDGQTGIAVSTALAFALGHGVGEAGGLDRIASP